MEFYIPPLPGIQNPHQLKYPSRYNLLTSILGKQPQLFCKGIFGDNIC